MSKKQKKPVQDSGEIYRQYRSRLKAFISGRVPNREESEDILHDVFYSLSRIDLAENPIEQVSAWLYNAARNRITDRYRKKRELSLSSAPEPDEEGFLDHISEILTAVTDTPETDFLKSLVWQELEEALAELPPEQRSIFELTEMEGFSFREIAGSTGVPVNTLISRKRYAVLHLRERLRELYEAIAGE